MRSIWLVIKHDFGVVIRQRSFWLFTLLVPALLLGLNIYSEIQGNDLATPVEESQGAGSGGEPEARPVIGIVDPSGLIGHIPPDLPQEMFALFEAQDSAAAALDNGSIMQYVLVPPDYLDTGDVWIYDRDFQIRLDGENMGVAFNSDQEWMLPHLLTFNLTGDGTLAAALENPTPGNLARLHALEPAPAQNASNQALVEIISSVVPYIYYFVMVIGSGYLLRSVAAEKENRTMEVLMLSLPPRDLMVGKLLAMSAVALVQLAVWAGAGLLLMDRSAALLNVSAFEFPPGFFLWASLFLVLGFLLYGAVMAAAGALAPNAREGNQVIWLLIIPLMPTLMFGDLFVEEPTNPLTILLSLFPFSAPGAMVTRLVGGEVPWWQLGLSVAGLAATTYVVLVLAGRFFHAGNLLSDSPFKIKRLFTEWRAGGGRAG